MDARQVSIVEFVNSPSLQFLSFITSGRIVIYYPQVVVDFLVTFTLYITNTLLLYTLWVLVFKSPTAVIMRILFAPHKNHLVPVFTSDLAYALVRFTFKLIQPGRKLCRYLQLAASEFWLGIKLLCQLPCRLVGVAYTNLRSYWYDSRLAQEIQKLSWPSQDKAMCVISLRGSNPLFRLTDLKSIQLYIGVQVLTASDKILLVYYVIVNSSISFITHIFMFSTIMIGTYYSPPGSSSPTACVGCPALAGKNIIVISGCVAWSS